MYKISEFSNITGLTVTALRYYDDSVYSVIVHKASTGGTTTPLSPQTSVYDQNPKTGAQESTQLFCTVTFGLALGLTAMFVYRKKMDRSKKKAEPCRKTET